MKATTHPILVETMAVSGSSVASWRTTIDTYLAAYTGEPVESVLVNLGANDVGSALAQATWEGQLGYILDAMNAKWPGVKVYVMRPWRRGYAAECNTLATWIANVVGARAAWAFDGPDERVFLENGDDGTTYTSDGIHPNAAGFALTAVQWQTALGY
jgi:lysophospholipase L1-like esterase